MDESASCGTLRGVQFGTFERVNWAVSFSGVARSGHSRTLELAGSAVIAWSVRQLRIRTVFAESKIAWRDPSITGI